MSKVGSGWYTKGGSVELEAQVDVCFPERGKFEKKKSTTQSKIAQVKNPADIKENVGESPN